MHIAYSIKIHKCCLLEMILCLLKFALCLIPNKLSIIKCILFAQLLYWLINMHSAN